MKANSQVDNIINLLPPHEIQMIKYVVAKLEGQIKAITNDRVKWFVMTKFYELNKDELLRIKLNMKEKT